MTLRSIILGGTAAAALVCGGLVAPSLAQQQPATTPDQSAPAAQSAAPSTPDATTDTSSATKDMSAPKHHARHHHHYMHSARRGGGRSTPSERAETQRLNQDQLAKARGQSQGQYGTMEQQPAPSAAPLSAPNSSTPQQMENKATAPMQNNPPPANNPQPQNPSQPPQK